LIVQQELFKTKYFTPLLRLLKSFSVFILSGNLLYNLAPIFAKLFCSKVVLHLCVSKFILFIYLFIYSSSINPLQVQRPTGCGSSLGTLNNIMYLLGSRSEIDIKTHLNE
jgi:hypothetical protein